MKYWRVSYGVDFIKQTSILVVSTQAKIHNAVSKVANHEDPRDAGRYVDCGRDGGGADCHYIAQIYAGLAFEFIYEINEKDKELTYIDCHELDFLKHGQEQNI